MFRADRDGFKGILLDSHFALDYEQIHRDAELHYDLLDSFVDQHRLNPDDNASQEGQSLKHRIDRFPMLLPLLFMDRYMASHTGKRSGGDTDNDTNSPMTSFQNTTGKAVKAYISAYEQHNGATGTQFTKYKKLLKKSAEAKGDTFDLLLFLTHPAIRNHLLSLWLGGARVPLIEHDILDTWGKHFNIPLAEQTIACPPCARKSAQWRHDRVVLNAGYMSLLPRIMEVVLTFGADESAIERDIEGAWLTFNALFAIASLYADVSVMADMEGIWPDGIYAFKNIQLVFTTSVSKHTLNAVLDSSKLFDGFIPSSLDLAQNYRNRGVNGLKPIYRLSGNAINASMVQRLCEGLISPRRLLAHPEHQNVSEHIHLMQEAWDRFRQGEVLAAHQSQRHFLLANAEIGVATKASVRIGTPPRKEDVKREAAISTVNGLISSIFYLETDDNKALLVDLKARLSTIEEMSRSIIALLPETPVDKASRPGIPEWLSETPSDESGVPADDTVVLLLDPAEIPNGHVPASGAPLILSQLDDTALSKLMCHSMEIARSINAFFSDISRLQLLIENGSYRLNQELEAANNAYADTSTGAQNTFGALEKRMAAMDSVRERYRDFADTFIKRVSHAVKEAEALSLARLVAMPCRWRPDDTTIETPQPDVRNDELAVTEQIVRQQEEERRALVQEYKALSELVTTLETENQALRSQLKSVSHHLSQAEQRRSATSDNDTTLVHALTGVLLRYSETPRPEHALAIVQALYPERIRLLDSAFTSAQEAHGLNGQNVLRRLLVLSTQGWDIARTGRPLYDLNDVLPGELALSESDSNLNDPRLREARTFTEHRDDGTRKEWLMPSHNWLDFEHRLHFAWDSDTYQFVIGYAGRHLPISSVS